MATEFLHGVRLVIANDGYIELRTPSTAIIGVVCTAEDADADMFPLDRCVLITNLQRAISKAGDTGTLVETLNAIHSEARTAVVVVRTKEGATDEETIANIIGKINPDDTRTGMKVLELANIQTGIQPRIFCVPLYDKEQAIALAIMELAERSYGFAYVSASHCENEAAAIIYRKQFSIDTGMLIYGDVIKFNTNLAMETEHWAAPQFCGLRARIDQEKGWHHSISNHALKSVLGVTKEVTYDGINGYGTGANILNEAGISVIVQDQGYRTWGNRTVAPTDSSMYFETSIRSSQVIAVTQAQLLKDITQDKPMQGTANSVLKTFIARSNRFLGDWERAGYILGGTCILDPEKNSVDDLMSGRPDWITRFTPCIPIESPGLTVTITDEFVTNALGVA